MQKLSNINELAVAVVAESCKDRFFYFVKTFWGVIIKEPPVFNWHIEYLCDEAQIASENILLRRPKLYDLIINIPPGTTKSTIVTVMLNAWLWAKDSTIKVITNSYSNGLSIDHATKTKDIVVSELYQRLFPHVQIRFDKSGKQNFETTDTGFRYATSTGSTITGYHAHLIINDDPQNPKQAGSAPLRLQANEHTKTLSSRKVDKQITVTITIMQRLNELDTTGYLLARKSEGIKHICLPAELSDQVKPEILKEKYQNGLLDPIRLSREVLDEAKTDLGSRAYAGQFEQSPTEDGGNIIKKEWFGHCSREDFKRMGDVPITFFVDTAYTEMAENDPTGIMATCKIGNDMYIVGAKTVHMKFPDLIRWLPEWVTAYGYTSKSTIRIEPKANGLSVIDQMKEITHLNITKTPTPAESKETRLNACSPIIESGRVFLINDNWNEEVIEEVSGFPNKAHDEYVDLICYAIDYHLKQKGKQIDKKRLLQNIY